MKGLLGGLLALGLIAGAAPAHAAAMLQSVTFELPLGALAPPPIVSPADGLSQGAGLPATVVAEGINGVATVTGITSAPPITAVQLSLTGNAMGNFIPSGGADGQLGGAMTLKGIARVKAFGGAVTLLGIPLTVIGQPNGFLSTGVSIIVQVFGTGWTTGQQTVMAGLTTLGGKQDPDNVSTVTATGADNRTANGGGALVLVSPTTIRTSLAGDIPTFAIVTLQYVPEPGSFLLLGAAVAAVAGIRRARTPRES